MAIDELDRAIKRIKGRRKVVHRNNDFTTYVLCMFSSTGGILICSRKNFM